jgi:Secretion system C-terminal sorting domain
MRKLYSLIVLSIILLVSDNLSAQTIWTGATMTFTKSDSADWTKEENQDRLTDSVWLTRAHTQSMFNIVAEASYTSFLSPAGTEWSFGTTADMDTLTFENFQLANGGKPQKMINKDMVLHLIADDIYIDIKFTSFSGGGPAGGFAYERSTKQGLSTKELEPQKILKLYPNPSNDFIHILNISEFENIKIYDILGTIVLEETISDNQKIDIHNLTKGLYFLRWTNGSVLNFIKD